MNWLTQDEISTWITAAGQIADPRNADPQPVCKITFDAPVRYAAVECFLRCFLGEVVQTGEILVVIADTEPSEPSQNSVLEAIRRFTGETRPVQISPGYRISGTEREKAIAMFSLMTCFRWKCYLYADHDQIVLYNWEGDIYDFWTSSESLQRLLSHTIQNFGLKRIPEDG